MEILILTGVLTSTLLLCSFGLGFYLGSKRKKEESFELTESNKDSVKALVDWFNYGGKQ